MKKNRFSAQIASGLLLAAATLALSSCANIIYREPEFQYAGRAVPPSGLLQRVMVSYTTNGSSGGLVMLDGLRDTRTNVQNTIPFFPIAGYSSGLPTQIINFPEEQMGYVVSQSDGSVGQINYAKEASSGSVATFGSYPPSVAVPPNGSRLYGAVNSQGLLEVVAPGGGTFALNLPNVTRVVVNSGNSVVLAMVRNSNTLYRLVRLAQTTTTTAPPGAVDCEPLVNPIYCMVPVGNTKTVGSTTVNVFDQPTDAYFSLDGSSVYILNCGPECGGTTAGVTVLNTGPLQVDNIPTVNPATQPAPLTTLPVSNPVAIPGGVTMAVSDGTNLYLAGQSQQTSSMFAGKLLGGNLTVLPLATFVPSAPVSISDGTHTRMLFADDNTLWIGSQQCASGVRAATAAYQLANGGTTTQAGNYNCLTRVQLGSATPTATIIPQVTQTKTGANAVTVAYPNTDQNPYYYGSLTGICWVQLYHKVYTAYGGQIHAFLTADGTEINNQYITVQGTALDVAYMDALTNKDN